MSIRVLSRPYTCVFGAPVLDRVDPRLFTLTYFGLCMDCGTCQDACCQYGVDVELPRMRAIERHRAELEEYTGWSREWWFRDDPEDVGIQDDAEYPGGQYTRTQVVDLPPGRSAHTETGCVFLDPTGRGCLLHQFALERGIEVHQIKPMMCMLFPASFNGGVLAPALEFEVEGEPVCRGPGLSVYRGARADILYYFGAEFVAELDAIEREELARGAGPAIPLPVCAP